MQYGGGRDLSAAVTRALLRPLLSPSSVPPQSLLRARLAALGGAALPFAVAMPLRAQPPPRLLASAASPSRDPTAPADPAAFDPPGSASLPS